MFNVGIDEIFVILFVCLVVFGLERLLGVARQAGRLTGQLRLLTPGRPRPAPGRSLPDLRVGSLHA